ncbi:DUF5685 family protein [Smaragdicoccus niigatensis]|uniref:DUF5685 family protein n=1 Tax=Smaragdicoccus niigatensis TaxID=359359 RepID=UPI00039BCC6B|nr:DUF5685 family protein [Smaragdicoccus niigatensis]
MFGVVRPCASGKEAWREHMCGLCLSLRDGHGQVARATTNTDAIVLSLLTEAQSGRASRRTAGPCPLRGMKTASVVTSDSAGAELAATASLLLGAAKATDWAADGDGRFRARLSKRPARKWRAEAHERGSRIGLDVQPLWTAITSQKARECAGIALDEVTWPAEFCAGELYAHSAVLADRPENVVPLRTIGRAIGRIAHLSDAVADLKVDRKRGAFNPIDATGTSLAEVDDLLGRARDQVRSATAVLTLADPEPVSTILVHGTNRALASAQEPVQRPGLLTGVGLLVGGYCTGYACCFEHTAPCTGERKPPIGCDCDCGDCACCCDDCCCDCGCDC